MAGLETSQGGEQEKFNKPSSKECLDCASRMNDPNAVFRASMLGKTFDRKNPEGNMKIPTEKEFVSVNFDMRGNIFTVGGKSYKAKLPGGAELDKVSFSENGINITGKLGIISQTQTISYDNLLDLLKKLSSAQTPEFTTKLGSNNVTFVAQDTSTKKTSAKSGTCRG